MRPFIQTEAAKTQTALTISVTTESPLYSAPIQQDAVREKIQEAIVISNISNRGAL